MEITIEEGEELYLAFIDLRAYFDIVEREKIWKVLKDLEVPEDLINIIRSIRLLTYRYDYKDRKNI